MDWKQGPFLRPFIFSQPIFESICLPTADPLPYLKYQPDLLFTGTELLGPGHVLITDENGKVENIVPENEAGLDVRQLHGLLSPGLVNCHCHLELSHMKGLIPEHTGLVDFVFRVVTERHFAEEAIADAIRLAEEEMRSNGIVAVGDICNNDSTVSQKQQGNLAYYNFIETSGWLPSVTNVRFERSADLLEKFQSLPSSISPHAPYSVSEALWKKMEPGFAGKTITIHNQETAFEDTLFEKGEGDFTRMYGMMKLDTSFFQPSGKSSLQTYLPKLNTASQVLLVHNTFTKPADIAFAQQHQKNINWCFCVNANLYIEQALPDIQSFRQHHCNIVVGTDSLASNHSLDVLGELKTIHRHFPGIPLAELLSWATLNGARALQMEKRLGSFEKGKQPGLVLIDGLENDTLTSASVAQKI